MKKNTVGGSSARNSSLIFSNSLLIPFPDIFLVQGDLYSCSVTTSTRPERTAFVSTSHRPLAA
jgi:hypothetical protein